MFKRLLKTIFPHTKEDFEEILGILAFLLFFILLMSVMMGALYLVIYVIGLVASHIYFNFNSKNIAIIVSIALAIVFFWGIFGDLLTNRFRKFK